MKSTLRNMILSLGCISAGVAVILGVVHSLTAEPIRVQAENAAVEAIEAVLPRFDSNPQAEALTVDDCEIYPVSFEGKFVGAAVNVSTMDGFSGLIRIMAGFDAAGTLTGYTILEQAETPGLGAKAGEWFRDPVADRSVIGSAGELKVKKDGGNIDAITAATITSRAFLGAINHAREAFNQYLSQK